MMTIKFSIAIMSSLVCFSVLISAYFQGTKVPVGHCDKIVDHVKNTRGVFSLSHSSVLAKCKIASDKQRGCGEDRWLLHLADMLPVSSFLSPPPLQTLLSPVLCSVLLFFSFALSFLGRCCGLAVHRA